MPRSSWARSVSLVSKTWLLALPGQAHPARTLPELGGRTDRVAPCPRAWTTRRASTSTNARAARRSTCSAWAWTFPWAASWSASLGYRADLETAKSLEKSLMLMYHHQCFGLGLGFASDTLEDRIELMIELQGLNF